MVLFGEGESGLVRHVDTLLNLMRTLPTLSVKASGLVKPVIPDGLLENTKLSMG